MAAVNKVGLFNEKEKAPSQETHQTKQSRLGANKPSSRTDNNS
jgi:hypothetical protein